MITEITAGHIRMSVNGRDVRILGEALMPVGGSPGGFAAWVDTLRWEDGGEMSASDREEVLADLRSSAEQRGLRLEVEGG